MSLTECRYVVIVVPSVLKRSAVVVGGPKGSSIGPEVTKYKSSPYSVNIGRAAGGVECPLSNSPICDTETPSVRNVVPPKVRYSSDANSVSNTG